MKQTILSKKESPLLEYAISKLNPDVFSHPVWVRFGRQGDDNTARSIEGLFSAAQKFQNDNPGVACQLMLACSVFQNYSNLRQSALETVQQVLALAKRANLTREFIWANWGASAICIQQGNYKQAATYLDDLQAALSKESEWVLADFIEVIKQSLFHPTMTREKSDEKIPEDPLNDDLVHLTFLWIQQWGLESQAPYTDSGKTSRNSGSFRFVKQISPRALFSSQRWQGFWRYFWRIFGNKLKPHWTEKNAPPAKRGSKLGQSFPNSLQLSPPNQEIENQIVEDIAVSTISSPIKTDSHPNVSFAALNSPSKNEKISEQTDTVIPLTVQMLGTFNITIQDTPIKLHATRGLSLLKYLLFHHKQRIPREVLMDIFWPDAEPETARNNLNVAMHGLRRALRTSTFLPVIVFEDGAYGLDPILQVWLDVEEFERCIKAGQRLEAQKQLTCCSD